jgi:hypothetical protein
MREQFITKRFLPKSRAIIAQANEIIADYTAQGFQLTLRQIYYQFVARDLLPNTEKSYKSLGKILNDGRLAGQIDWDAIEDRTRSLETNLRLRDPKHGVQIIRDQYGIDMWKNQERRVEVWIEKEALAGVIAGVCSELDVPYFACRGYVSQSEEWRAYRRHKKQQETVVLHLGDHDPSGIDMTRDNQYRLNLFHGALRHSEVRRIALNMEQINEYDPPPNPAKVTDARFRTYQAEFGNESWELDALEPQVLVDLIRETIGEYVDDDAWAERQEQLEEDLATLDQFLEELD